VNRIAVMNIFPKPGVTIPYLKWRLDGELCDSCLGGELECNGDRIYYHGGEIGPTTLNRIRNTNCVKRVEYDRGI